jgi:hypothetical protein
MPVPSETIILLSITGQQSVVCRSALIKTMKPEVTELIFKIFDPLNKQSASLVQSFW